MSKRFQADFLLLLVAVVWGGGFIAQRIGAQNTGFLLFNGCRFLMGMVVLLPFIFRKLRLDRLQLKWILVAGVILGCASALQQEGLRYTTASNAGFITGAYVVLTPLLLTLFWKQHSSLISWMAALMVGVGVLLLSTEGRLSLAPGDLLELCGAFLWALHVIVVGRAVQRVDALVFAAGQFGVAGLLSMLLGLVFQSTTLPGLAAAGWAVLYAGVISTGVGFTLQGVGQRLAPPVDAAILLSLEAVFAALGGMLLLGEQLSLIQWLGCGLILAAILLSQLPQKNTISTVAQPPLS